MNNPTHNNLNKPILDIFIGLQVSGKTTFSKSDKYQGYVHINLDTLKKRNREWRVFTEALQSQQNITIDNTNPSRKERERYIVEANKYGYYIVCHFLQSRLKDCIERNNLRESPIPIKGLVNTSRRIELPTMEEGYSEMYFVQMKDGVFVESKWIEENSYEIW